MSTMMTGGEVVAKMLAIEGVKNLFGIIDGTYFGFYSNLEKHGIRLISPRHETSAAHMAGAYARTSNRLGVCMASNGPGVANILPGLVVEQAEGNRVLCITSARRTGIMYPDRGGTYQCFDQTGTIKQFAKWSEAVPSFDRIPEMLRMALRKCFEGRPGVVHVDIPENIMNTKVKCDISFWEPSQYRMMELPKASQYQVERAMMLLKEANFPIIHAGSGVLHSGAKAELTEFAQRMNMMVTTSWAGRGAMSEEHDLMMPMVHIEANNNIRSEADVVLILGSRVGETDWWGKAPYWNPHQKVIQIDLDPMILGANKPADLLIQADIKFFLQQMLQQLAQDGETHVNRQRQQSISKHLATKQAHRKKLDEHLKDNSKPINPARVPNAIGKVFPKHTPLVMDGGNTVIWANFYYTVNDVMPLHSTFKFGMLGAGVGQALGVAVAKPNTPVVCIIGDGAMGFHPQEIETAIRNHLHVVYIVMCDKQWGMVKMNQHFALRPLKTMLKKTLDPHESINADLGEIRFDLVAEAMGAHGEYVTHPNQLEEAMQRSIEVGKCTVIHVEVDPVKHMWAPGLRYFKDMHAEPKGK
ncbi:thiamine pyrophosphate-binding protein [Caryophanon tenue]|uniref:Thiamine pyrophosphate-binding protein n=1 Tax=Caryophanon tenue TaxID=33978 RepID=A0A1C0YHX1_9BACL|nr:thiamine pyrophosphate-binding protein [Caryophanon tenue]OCS86775.1 thiamine pyrophosphate-binding protein [Caryophanon tenue]